MHLKLHHGRRAGQRLGRQQILSDNHNLCARRADILLHARVNQAILRHIHRLRKETGRHIRNQNFTLGIRQRMIFGAVNRIVLTDIDIIHIICYWKIGAIGNIGESLIRRGRQFHGFPVNLCLRKSLLCPLPGQNITRLAVLHQIHGHRREQKACAAL